MNNTIDWRDQVRVDHGDTSLSADFIARIEHYTKNYNKAKNKDTSKDPLDSLVLFERLEGDANRLRATMNRVKPEHRNILSRGQTYETAEEYVAFFELMTEIENNLDEWTTQLGAIREVLERQPLRGQVREIKHEARNAFIGITCLTYETMFGGSATFENKVFNNFLKLLAGELGIPNRKMRRLYENAYPSDLRDNNPLEILQF